MGPVHKERDLNLIGSDSQKRGRGVEDMSKDMVGEGRKTSAGDVNKSKRNWEKRNSEGVSHDGRGVSKWVSLLSVKSRLSPYWQIDIGIVVRLVMTLLLLTSYRLSSFLVVVNNLPLISTPDCLEHRRLASPTSLRSG